MDELQQKLKTFLSSKGRKIVLVGNAPSAMQYNIQKIENDIIIARFNDYVVENMEDKVGSRTDIWCVGQHVYNHLVSTKKPPNMFTLVTYPSERNKRPIHVNSTTFNVYSDYFPEVIEAFSKFGGKAWASTGLLSVMTLSRTFDDVRIAGFDFFKSNAHYMPPDSGAVWLSRHENKIGKGHDTNVEEDLILSKVSFLETSYRAEKQLLGIHNLMFHALFD